MKLPEYPEDAVPIDTRLLAQPGVRVGWFTGATKSSRVTGTTLSPAHHVGGDALEGVAAKLVVDIKLDGATRTIIPNVDARTVFDAEDRPQR